MVTIDPAAVLWSAPERERADRPLLVLLHGFGSHEGDLFGLSPQLPLGPVIASVRAPLTLQQGSYSWAPLASQVDPVEVASAANDAARAILDWLDTTESTSVGLLGFSQGGAMAMQLLRNAPDRFAFAVNLSGFAVLDQHPGDAELATRKPPVFWGRGTLDQVITPDKIAYTEEWLPEHSTLTARIYEELPHSIARPELDDVNAFIRSVWN
ncbi:phospholipase/carboxylesterase [Conyzicola lurida]|uniref:Phospholipase/carboxylesterase n=1 Tax=Conyzicola lurida TaxID=1172621 RepID=A0A841AJY3_9MICO|nr:dienelactone hydrolase family protein [Conyzicola lurida]MBB5841775.1 phospholipase/carboxylesterase [Conyzicola lurida]